jgi:hypothetical protein
MHLTRERGLYSVYLQELRNSYREVFRSMAVLPDGRVLAANFDTISLLTGFVRMPTPRQHMAAHRLHRFGRDVSYNPRYKRARRHVMNAAGFSEEAIDQAEAARRKTLLRRRTKAMRTMLYTKFGKKVARKRATRKPTSKKSTRVTLHPRTARAARGHSSKQPRKKTRRGAAV